MSRKKPPDIWFYIDRKGLYRWHAMVRGRILADSHRGYETKDEAKEAVRTLFGQTAIP